MKKKRTKKKSGGRPAHPQAAGKSEQPKGKADAASTTPGSTTPTGRKRDAAPSSVGAVAPAEAVRKATSAKADSNGATGDRDIRVHGEAAHVLAHMKSGEFIADHHAPDHVHEAPRSFLRKYVFSIDHKVIGIQFMFTSLAFMVLAGVLALVVRWSLGYPGEAMPGGTFLPDDLAYEGKITPNLYNQAFTMHASLMIFFVIIPMLVGAFGNFLIPLQIGARDMAFPFINALSYWLAVIAGAIMVVGFFLPGGAASGGWTSYPPVTNINAPAGQMAWFASVFILGLSSVTGAINYLTTMVNMRTPGMTMMRMPLTCWALFITSVLILFSTPVLGSAMIMQLSDSMLGTSFFIPDYSIVGGTVSSQLAEHAGGGFPLLYQHLFWFYSHPAVYIMILPAMGIVSEILSVFSRKPIFGYKMMVFAIALIAFLGFIVWGHHMFVSGMNPYLGTTFMVSTMFIAVPSAIKTFNWLGTMWGGTIRFTTPMLNALSFVSMFIIGGLSGIFMASTPVDIQIHDSYFIVGHIHYVLFGGSMFGIFAGIYHWFPKMFGRMMNETLGKIHFWLTFITFNCTFFPMHILGTGGMMRRVPNPLEYEHLWGIQWINTFCTVSAIALGIAQLVLVYNFFGSLFAHRRNVWGLRYVGDVITAGFIALLAGGVVDAIAKGGQALAPVEESGSYIGESFAQMMPFFNRGDLAWPVVLALFFASVIGLQVRRQMTIKFIGVLLVMIAAMPLAKIWDVYATRKTIYDGLQWGYNLKQGGGLDAGPGNWPFPWLYSMSAVALTFVLAIGAGFWALVSKLTLGDIAPANPWEATTLEWTACTSPPWYANFEELPRVHHGPHEYNVPGVSQDWLPQNVAYKEATSKA